MLTNYVGLVSLSGLLLLSVPVLAQKKAAKPVAKKPVGVVFSVSPQTHLITYQDSVVVPGATVEVLNERFADVYRRNFIYADYNLLNPRDTTHQLRPRQKAGPDELAAVGTVMLARPGEQVVFVPGITPPEALKHAPPIRYLHFTVRLRAVPGRAYLTITDLHQRSTTMRQVILRQFGLDLNAKTQQPAAPVELPASTPVEALYWSWLPPAAQVATRPRQPAGEPVPTSADAQLVVGTVQAVLSGFRYGLMRQ